MFCLTSGEDRFRPKRTLEGVFPGYFSKLLPQETKTFTIYIKHGQHGVRRGEPVIFILIAVDVSMYKFQPLNCKLRGIVSPYLLDKSVQLFVAIWHGSLFPHEMIDHWKSASRSHHTHHGQLYCPSMVENINGGGWLKWQTKTKVWRNCLLSTHSPVCLSTVAALSGNY